MCGVLGIAGPQGPELVDRLLGDLARRGPDDEGRWTSPELTLGHRRLSIIGLDPAGCQPMTSRSGQSILVFNGEVYNYLELADELEAIGRPCDRRFDSAVLLEALEAWGVEALAKLNGMFALAWFRPREHRLLLARDRWGKKPLFWGPYRAADGQSYLAFSSQLATFARLPAGPPPPDPLGIARYLVYDGMPDTRTVYRNVAKVAAASWVEVDLQGRQQDGGTYWRFAPPIEPIEPALASERATERLSRALELRLRSDVPVGLFLSGGMDSSLLAALWRRQRPDETIRTFTVGFDDASYDERGSARVMARAIDSEHHEIVVSGQQLEEGLHQVLDNLPEPFADPSIVPTSLLCRFASQHVKVAIGGDGGDELQAGYDPFRAWTVANWLTALAPGRLWNHGLATLERLAPASTANMSLKFKLHHFRQGLLHSREERTQAWMASFPVRQVVDILEPELAEQIDEEEILEPTRRAFRAWSDVSELQAQIHTWVATYLESSILTKVDRASMMHSLEVRAPFLDPEVADGLTGLPPKLIFHGGKGKVLLRRLAQDLLPEELLAKPKKGLGVPLTTWFRTVLRERMGNALEATKTAGWFRHDAMQSLWNEHLEGRYDHRKALWSFLTSSRFQSRL
ncbi:MAG: asparagine synthase (glutamine-hydrolyzing) [Acidobacteriota bacterium]